MQSTDQLHGMRNIATFGMILDYLELLEEHVRIRYETQEFQKLKDNFSHAVLQHTFRANTPDVALQKDVLDKLQYLIARILVIINNNISKKGEATNPEIIKALIDHCTKLRQSDIEGYPRKKASSSIQQTSTASEERSELTIPEDPLDYTKKANHRRSISVADTYKSSRPSAGFLPPTPAQNVATNLSSAAKEGQALIETLVTHSKTKWDAYKGNKHYKVIMEFIFNTATDLQKGNKTLSEFTAFINNQIEAHCLTRDMSREKYLKPVTKLSYSPKGRTLRKLLQFIYSQIDPSKPENATKIDQMNQYVQAVAPPPIFLGDQKQGQPFQDARTVTGPGPNTGR